MRLFRPKPVTVDLTSEAYCRWLRARSPQPLQDFLGYDELQQEALALLGDEYTSDIAIEAAYAIWNPDAAAGVTEDDDASIAARIANAAAPAPIAPEVRKAPTMGGTTKRQEDRVLVARQSKDAGRRLLGRRPDPIEVE